MIKNLFFLLLAPALPAAAAEPLNYETLAPAYIPAGRPALDELTAQVRAKIKTLGLNGLTGPAGKVSRALVLLPSDRMRSGVLTFELEKGPSAGLYQCEALGRGVTGAEPKPRWRETLFNGATVYYKPKDMSSGATVPGVYDVLNIEPSRYDIEFLDKPDGDLAARTARPAKPGKGKRLFSAVYSHWYPPGSPAVPVDMLWAADSQAGTQGAGVPAFEMPPLDERPESLARRARQLAANPNYYVGPYGRYGFAVHTDRWEDPEKLSDPKHAGRPEISDFRWRDTDGCVKLRRNCLELLNAFIAEQAGLGRRVQLEVYETPALDALPDEDPAAPKLSEYGVAAGGEGDQ